MAAEPCDGSGTITERQSLSAHHGGRAATLSRISWATVFVLAEFSLRSFVDPKADQIGNDNKTADL